ncbi:MAG: GAF domain-containing protein [Acidobacteria bacterium]|nr:GAF domain-containing protein [Acidobacteriota bacterium]
MVPVGDPIVDAISRLPAAQAALHVLCRVTGLRMALVARVTPESWTACAVLDDAGFGLEVGMTLDVTTTYCRDVSQSRAPLLVANGGQDPRFSGHPGLLLHGIHTYIAVPLMSLDGQALGTLCALDPEPRPVSNEVVSLFELLARLIALELEADDRQRQQALLLEQRASAVRALGESERRLRFLDRLGQETRALAQPEAVLALTARSLGEHLDAGRCSYARVTDDGDQFTIVHDWTSSRGPSWAGTYRLEQFGPRAYADLHAGRTLVVHDVPSELCGADGGDTFASLGIEALVCCPRVKDGRLLALMVVQQDYPRSWQPAEVALIEEVVERSWSYVESLQLQHALRETDRLKDEFLATLAHELRNPLAPIRSGLELLDRTPPDSVVATRARAVMGRQLSHLVRLVDDLMDVSRVNRGKIHLQHELVDVAAVIASAVETSAPAIHAASHDLSVGLPAGRLMLMADPVRLSQVFSNILMNAAKYTPRGGRIDVTGERHGDAVHVRVTDNGVGIRVDMVPRVFEMFTQAGPTQDRAQGGLGIGLTLVRRLVEMHGGTVSAHSDGLGRGTSVTVVLPVVEVGPSISDERLAPIEQRARPRVPGRRVLIVDDHADGAELLSLLLVEHGHDVAIASSGEAALDLLATFRPSLVFLDIGLPGISGYDVARHVRDDPDQAGTTLVAMTGWGSDDDKQRASEAGFDLHLTKPVDPAVLGAVLHELQTRGPRDQTGRH